MFAILCQDIGSDHKTLLLHSEVMQLFRCKVLNCLFELRFDMQAFLLTSKFKLEKCFFDEMWLVSLSYLADIFGRLSDLNLGL